jgi:hypothetical protein
MPICSLESEERIDRATGALQVRLSDEIKYLDSMFPRCHSLAEKTFLVAYGIQAISIHL